MMKIQECTQIFRSEVKYGQPYYPAFHQDFPNIQDYGISIMKMPVSPTLMLPNYAIHPTKWQDLSSRVSTIFEDL